MITVSTSSEQIKQLTDALSAIPGAATRAGQRAVNSTATGLRREAPKWIASVYAIPGKEILSRLKVDRAKGDIVQADVIGSDNKGLPLKAFTKKQYQSGSSTRPVGGGKYTPEVGVPVRIKKAGSFRPMPGVFTQTMRSGHTGLFKRIGDGNRIKEQYLASPLNILDQGEYPGKVEEYVDKKLPEELTRQIDLELKNA